MSKLNEFVQNHPELLNRVRKNMQVRHQSIARKMMYTKFYNRLSLYTDEEIDFDWFHWQISNNSRMYIFDNLL